MTEARGQLAEFVNLAAYAGETVLLTRRGRRMATLVPAARAPVPSVPEGARGRVPGAAEGR